MVIISQIVITDQYLAKLLGGFNRVGVRVCVHVYVLGCFAQNSDTPVCLQDVFD